MILAETALNCLFIIIAALAIGMVIANAYLAIADAWRHNDDMIVSKSRGPPTRRSKRKPAG
jgi:hypothetical protein